MKAILEFNYPEDEDKLRHALHGSTAIFALSEIDQMIRLWHKHDNGKPDDLINKVRAVASDALTECGEL